MSTSLQTNNNHVNHFACSEQFYTTTESHYPTKIISPLTTYLLCLYMLSDLTKYIKQHDLPSHVLSIVTISYLRGNRTK